MHILLEYDAAKLLEARERIGFSRSYVARCSGLAAPTIGHLERGSYKRVSSATLEAICRVLGIHPREVAPDYTTSLAPYVELVAIDGEALRDARLFRGYSFVDLAARAGVSEGWIRHHESGFRDKAPTTIVQRVARALRVRPGVIAPILDVPAGLGERALMEPVGEEV